ncbi:MarR family winged helix-turn-helix transcriptional regulator [Plebeiibacterium sediminum]|uniref:MarR family winged helix-turn-helix transcriptional regulator n=1 Tax=Plebeiibacterium sediminum TaxID=2992112 RepID=A0AAE3M9W4_9BACT|nr:MarR family winged helix-turn-helix transcriptional regulator [Plebeiobacterium sediminum]MCW3789489.1 MarR family winged helix-turn-helix transcriptional regulator [Plebeiobacterium sediminum]
MENSYKVIKELIDLWEAFENEAQEQHDLLNFSEWLTGQIKEKKVTNTKLESKSQLHYHPETVEYLSKLQPHSRFQEYILRIARFEEFYIRKYLIDLPLNSRLEYLFLFTIENLEKARKTDLINIHLVEYTTGMDTIRRLIKNNLLNELPDEQDKRAKVLILTNEGEEVLYKANRRMDEARNMFLACISPNKWKKTLSVLREINEFHSNIYLNHYDKPFAEISNLMDSLKHLHK